MILNWFIILRRLFVSFILEALLFSYASNTFSAQDGVHLCNNAFIKRLLVWEKLIISPSHPRLILTPEKLDELRQRVNPDHPAWPGLLKKANNGGAAEAALLFLVTKEVKYANMVASYLRYETPDWTEYSLAFDWAYAGWDELTRREMIAIFANRFGFFKEGLPSVNLYTDLNKPLPSETPENNWPNYYNWTFHSEDWADGSRDSERYSPYFALAGHIRPATEGVQRLWEMSFKDAALFLDYLGDGAAWEGGYWRPRGKQEKIAMVFRILDSATQLDFSMENFPYLPNIGYFLLYQTDLANGRLVMPYGDGNIVSTSEWQIRHNMLAANDLAKNPYFQWFLDNLTQPTNALKEALYYDPRIQAKHPRELPPTRLFPGSQMVMFRSGWEGKDDLIGMFRVSDWFDIHNHYDAGHLMLYKNGVLIGKAGYYGGEFKNAIRHNTLALEVPGDTTGGQRIFPRTWTFRIGKRAWLNTPDTFKRGCITSFESQPEYDYIAADVTPAYPPENVQIFDRQLVFIRPELLVIFDKVETTVNVQKKFLLHVVHPPRLGGERLHETWRKVGEEEIVSQGSGSSTLFAQSLLPERAQIRAINESSANIDHAAPWRIEIAPTAVKETDYFLNLVFAGSGPFAQMPESRYTKSISGDFMLGVHIKGETNNWHILFSEENKQIIETVYVLEDPEVVKNLICSLPVGASFEILKNGTLLKSGKTSSAGTIFFEDKPGENATYKVTVRKRIKELIID